MQLTQQKQINQAEAVAAAAALSSNRLLLQSQQTVGVVTGDNKQQAQTLCESSINIEGESLQLPFEAEDCSDGSGATDDTATGSGGGPAIASSGSSSSDESMLQLPSTAEDGMMPSSSVLPGASRAILGRGLVIVAGTNRLGEYAYLSLHPCINLTSLINTYTQRTLMRLSCAGSSPACTSAGPVTRRGST